MMPSVLLCALTACGCADRNGAHFLLPPPAVTVVVAPVLNLSNSNDWDPLKVTDWVASELQQFPGVTVIPVNRAAAALAQAGKTALRSPQDAVALADEFGADATLATAITEFNPYDPPIVGLVMQWYARSGEGAARISRSGTSQELDAVGGERLAAGAADPSATARTTPSRQVQRVYNAAMCSTLNEVKEFARTRQGVESPYKWRVHLKSQELFTRYCCHDAIRSMLSERTNGHGAADTQCELGSKGESADR
jgi:hypothetical protein